MKSEKFKIYSSYTSVAKLLCTSSHDLII